MTTRTTAILFGLLGTLIFGSGWSAPLFGSGWSAPRYRLTDIGPGVLVGMNKHGTVLATDASGNTFTYEHGRKTEITVAPTPEIPCSTPLQPLPEAINDRGDVVFDFLSPPSDCFVLLRDGKLTLVRESVKALVTGINNRDQVIGNAQDSTGLTFGFGANCTTFPNIDDIYQAYGINNGGDVVGSLESFFSPASPPRAALCRGSGAWIELGGLGGSGSRANAINERGLIVGHATTSAGDQHAFLYSHGWMIDLGTLSDRPGSISDALDINNEGQIVGWSQGDWNQDADPFVSVDHKLYSLQDSIDRRDRLFGHVRLLLSPVYINDRGSIAIMGVDSRTNDQHVYLMDPIHGHDGRHDDHDDRREDHDGERDD